MLYICVCVCVCIHDSRKFSTDYSSIFSIFTCSARYMLREFLLTISSFEIELQDYLLNPRFIQSI